MSKGSQEVPPEDPSTKMLVAGFSGGTSWEPFYKNVGCRVLRRYLLRTLQQTFWRIFGIGQCLLQGSQEVPPENLATNILKNPLHWALVLFRMICIDFCQRELLSLGVCRRALLLEGVIDSISQQLIFPVIGWARRFWMSRDLDRFWKSTAIFLALFYLLATAILKQRLYWTNGYFWRR